MLTKPTIITDSYTNNDCNYTHCNYTVFPEVVGIMRYTYKCNYIYKNISAKSNFIKIIAKLSPMLPCISTRDWAMDSNYRSLSLHTHTHARAHTS